jgi:hypothetical protein
MASGSDFRRMWLADASPRMIYLQLDGDGPLGDPYQVNSDNNGPYGDAITKELIPYVEQRFRAIAQPYARMLDGESTGGWVSLALKVFYPDFFNAVWSSCPDGVDFRGFQLINIYQDRNAYVDERGMDRPSKRDINGRVEFTIRRECQMENVIGLGDSWTMSGQQWGAWNAVYGPRGQNGRPVPLWDPRTGEIDRSVVGHWRKYDLRLVLEENWKTLAPKLRGKIHISVGEADNYFLNNAVHMLDDFLTKANPPANARIAFGPGRGHCWSSITELQMMQEMVDTAEQSGPGRGLLWEEQKSGTQPHLQGVSVVDRDIVWAGSIVAASVQRLMVAGGDYQNDDTSTTNFATSSNLGRTWTLGPNLPGYRSAIRSQNAGAPLDVAVGPFGTDYRESEGEHWINTARVGYDAARFLPGLATGWAVAEAGHIERWYQ